MDQMILRPPSLNSLPGGGDKRAKWFSRVIIREYYHRYRQYRARLSRTVDWWIPLHTRLVADPRRPRLSCLLAYTTMILSTE
jgi:hypothetical protein